MKYCRKFLILIVMESVGMKIETQQDCLETEKEGKQNTLSTESCQAQISANTEIPESSSSVLLPTNDSTTKLSKRAQKRLQKKALYESYKKEKRYP